MNSGNKIDTDALKESVNIVDVIGKHVELHKRGSEHYGICPFHDDHEESLQVNESKQVFKCFACGVGGDELEFLQRLGYGFKEACEELQGGNLNVETNPEQRRSKPRKNKVSTWRPVTPVPSTAPRPDFEHYKLGEPAGRWQYRNEYGAVVGYVLRFETPDGKQVLPYSFCTDGERKTWRFKGFEKPRPLYNLYELAQHPEKTVMICEGEKTADAAHELFDKAVGVGWVGGAQGIKYTDWSPLEGRKVILWPDNDQPGRDAMRDIADRIGDKVDVLKWVKNPADAPKKWDIADADWSPEEARAYVKKNLIDVPPAKEEEVEGPPGPAENGREGPAPVPEPEKNKEPESGGDDEEPEEDEEDTGYPDKGYNSDINKHRPAEKDYSNEHFKFLGYDKSQEGTQSFWFYSRGAKTTVKLTASSMTRNNLQTLAPLNWWEETYPAKSTFDLNAAVNWLIQVSNRVGPFKPDNIRGRGAWVDRNRVVLHGGDMLIIDGEPEPLGLIESKYIYEAAQSLDFKTKDPLGKEEAYKLIEITKLLNWERKVNALLLAGWSVVAPICGALNWRPHIWLTGAAGTGKSWVFQNIVRRCLGETSLAVQSATTEAGLRQLLKHDAIPVVFDEAEEENQRASDRISNILGLARAASADDGGIMAKGTSGGTAMTFTIRSCFAFASIGVPIKNQSDRGRVTILALTNPHDEEVKERRWKKLQKLHNETMTEEFVNRLQARTIRMIPTILENARTFSNAAAAVLGEQRQGDQLGALLAGAYSLHRDGLVEYDNAVKWIEQQDWSEEKGMEKTRDEYALVSYIMEQITRLNGRFSTTERNVGELVQIVAGARSETEIGEKDAYERLKRLGIRVENDSIVISNTAQWLTRTLQGTPWASNHNKILQRLEGAETVDATRFGSGIQTRAVEIPLSLVVAD